MCAVSLTRISFLYLGENDIERTCKRIHGGWGSRHLLSQNKHSGMCLFVRCTFSTTKVDTDTIRRSYRCQLQTGLSRHLKAKNRDFIHGGNIEPFICEWGNKSNGLQCLLRFHPLRLSRRNEERQMKAMKYELALKSLCNYVLNFFGCCWILL